MQVNQTNSLPAHPEKATLEGKNKILGFWFFIGSDVVLFASLFGTYLGLKGSTQGGPGPQDLFHLEYVALMTFILLLSSMTSVLGIKAMQRNDFARMQLWFWITILLGLAFLGLEIYEFYQFVVHEGLGYTTSAFASAFYTLLGFHGAHVTFGVLWFATLLIRSRTQGINTYTAPKFYVASLYWHFVDVVWVFVFTLVYLMGKVG
ncbi:cytochrome B oxidoreductase [Caldalkalibacillus thermarum]|uniref:cytochrome c oxidase subunit 3 n=1 Tax=Caldalkalibacillus thermarum TaxID=296745 RepID=UPI00166CBD9B|nr:cytochrome c oxidase subunit 3 [Caldalkalibacillus thermarum]GGK13101.1 cytochrome B oxidoreductase [Caldalkalibacillus thermarum]